LVHRENAAQCGARPLEPHRAGVSEIIGRFAKSLADFLKTIDKLQAQIVRCVLRIWRSQTKPSPKPPVCGFPPLRGGNTRELTARDRPRTSELNRMNSLRTNLKFSSRGRGGAIFWLSRLLRSTLRLFLHWERKAIRLPTWKTRGGCPSTACNPGHCRSLPLAYRMLT
jgi:hypothetical protein